MRNLRLGWALDPVAMPASNIKNSVKFFGALEKTGPIEIDPVSVVCPDQVNWPLSFSREWMTGFSETAKQMVAKGLKSVKLKALADPEVLFENEHSKKNAIDLLEKWGKSRNLDWWVVRTHLKEGMGRAFVGSFAEALLTRSSRPVLVFNSHEQDLKKLSSVLFPTDFSPSSWKILRKLALDLADRKIPILIFHYRPKEDDRMLVQSSAWFGGVEKLRDYLLAEELEKNKIGAQWVSQLHGLGVESELVFAHGNKPLAKAINEASHKARASMVVLPTFTGRWEQVVFGSVAREVMRGSKVPTLVLKEES